MRRRVLLATLTAVILAVVLLGVPLAVAGVLLVRDRAAQDLQRQATGVATALDRRIAVGENVDEELLASIGLRDLPGGWIQASKGSRSWVAGDRPTGGVLSAQARTASGVQVEILIPSTSLNDDTAAVIALVAVAMTVAIAAAVAVALFQARRLARPLVQLAAMAEHLGSGAAPTPPLPSGVAEVDRVAAELARGSERVTARLAAERDFAAEASHQLRTPLAALSLRLEEISATEDPHAVHEEARIALDQVERLTSVVQDLLVRARGPRDPSPTELSLGDVLRQQGEEWQGSFRAAGRVLDVEPAAGLRVVATVGGLSQVLACLIENSLRHGAGTTRVRARRTGTSVVVEVSDEGPGVPAELGSRIFERNVSSTGGTGLGLALARDLAVADGGRLELAKQRPPVFALFLGAPRAGD